VSLLVCKLKNLCLLGCSHRHRGHSPLFTIRLRGVSFDPRSRKGTPAWLFLTEGCIALSLQSWFRLCPLEVGTAENTHTRSAICARGSVSAGGSHLIIMFQLCPQGVDHLQAIRGVHVCRHLQSHRDNSTTRHMTAVFAVISPGCESAPRFASLDLGFDPYFEVHRAGCDVHRGMAMSARHRREAEGRAALHKTNEWCPLPGRHRRNHTPAWLEAPSAAPY
jgi:hypothetical protein